MEKDLLKQFIENHRAEFDRAHPPAAVWDRIADELDKRSYRHTPRIYTIMKIAAAVTVVLAIGFVIGMYSFSPSNNSQQMMAKLGPDTYQRYQDVQQYYTHQVAEKWTEVQQLKSQVPGTSNGKIDDDLNQLDAIFHELQNELMKNSGIDDEKIIDAMILNYRTKIEILEKVSNKLKEQTSQAKRNETVDI